ncbi:MAG: SGNH/GDSL hydrolase family protein [Planctomycetia bacterium]|jgi:lysophospholipase L1-like esterase
MKTILCYGDSNTWGYIPGTASRYPRQVRWTGVLQNLLGEKFHVIEEGLNGRTTVMDDPTRIAKNGLPYLRPCLDSHAPIDLVVLMLGTNDTKHRFGLSAFDISEGVAMLVNIIQQSAAGLNNRAPAILLVSPVVLDPAPEKSDLFEGAAQKSRELAGHMENVAKANRCAFLDASLHTGVSPIDGIHLDEEGHQALGHAIAQKIQHLVG